MASYNELLHANRELRAELEDAEESLRAILSSEQDAIRNHKHSDEELLRLAAIVRHSNDAIISKTLDGIVTSWNRGATAIFGYSADEMISKPMSILIPPDEIGEERMLLQKIAHGETVKNYDTVRMTKDGGQVFVSVSLSPIRDGQGKIVGASKVAQDITERKQAEARLQKYAKRLEAINRLDRIIASNLDIRLVYDNFVKELPALMELDRTSIVRLNESGDQWQVTRQWTKHQPALRPNQWFPVAGSVIELVATNRIPYSEPEIGQHEEWPETEILRREGIRSRILLPLIIQGQVAGLVTVASRQPFAFSEDDQSILMTFADQLAIAIQNAELYAQVQHHAAEMEQRVIEKTAQLEASNEELEAFSYSVSHDLRSPLRSIDGFSRMLLRDNEALLPVDAQRKLHLIRDNAQQMGVLIDDLLNFSLLNRQPLNKQSVDIASMAGQILGELINQQANRQIEIHIGDLPLCQGDPALLKQVLVNLLSNALKFTRNRAVASITVGYQLKDGEGVYTVSDNGVGFDMAYADKLFGVFQRLHFAEDYEGTGVGLAIIKRIIQRHGGRIWVEAEVDKGATFFFTLEGENLHD